MGNLNVLWSIACPSWILQNIKDSITNLQHTKEGGRGRTAKVEPPTKIKLFIHHIYSDQNMDNEKKLPSAEKNRRNLHIQSLKSSPPNQKKNENQPQLEIWDRNFISVIRFLIQETKPSS